jgi:hypothetical protein
VLAPAAPDAAVAVGSGSVVVAAGAGSAVVADCTGATAVAVEAGVVAGGGVVVCVAGGDVVCDAVWVAGWVVDPSGLVYWAQPAHEAALVAGTTSDAVPAPTRIAPATTAATRRRRTPTTGRVKQPVTLDASPGVRERV